MKDRKIWLTIMMLAVMATVGVASGQTTTSALINFQVDESLHDLPAGYEYDEGNPFKYGRNGMDYGWDDGVGVREKFIHADRRYDTFAKMSDNGGSTWEIGVPDGIYDLFVVFGDPGNTDSTQNVDVEGIVVIDLTPNCVGDSDNYDEYTVQNIVVTDGRLSIKPAAGANNVKICFLELMIGDETYNPAPTANAGPDQVGYTIDTFQLDGSASSDHGSVDGTTSVGGIASSYWTQKSGPAGGATFDPVGGIDDLSPTVTFSVKGVYELQLQLFDEEPKDANDIVVITVKDHADEFIVGHWDLDGDALDLSGYDNHGTLEGTEGSIPEAMPQFDIDAAVGSHSIDLRDSLGLAADDPNVPRINLGLAPELNFSTGDFTVSLWTKTSTHDQYDKGTIFAHGSNNLGGYRVMMNQSTSNTGRIGFVCKDGAAGSTKDSAETNNGFDDGYWHHILAMRTGANLYMYYDGILSGRKNSGVAEDFDVTDPVPFNNYIGAVINGSAGTLTGHYDGHVDDVRIYNYALPADDAGYIDVLDLTAMGPIVATVNAGNDFSINWKPVGAPPAPLAGSITDPGANPVTSGLWSTTAGPADANAVFFNETDPLSTVTFPAAGTYTLKLEVVDADAVTVTNPLGLVSDTVVVTVNAPTCAEVILAGDGLDIDLDEDCYIGLSDLVIFVNEYLKCNDPQDVDCSWVF